MKKIKLDLDALSVESFVTDPTLRRAARGTVMGHGVTDGIECAPSVGQEVCDTNLGCLTDFAACTDDLHFTGCETNAGQGTDCEEGDTSFGLGCGDDFTNLCGDTQAENCLCDSEEFGDACDWTDCCGDPP